MWLGKKKTYFPIWGVFSSEYTVPVTVPFLRKRYQQISRRRRRAAPACVRKNRSGDEKPKRAASPLSSCVLCVSSPKHAPLYLPLSLSLSLSPSRSVYVYLSLSLSLAQCVASPGSALLPLRSPPGLWRRAGPLTHSPGSEGVHAARAHVYRITVGTSTRLHVAPHWLKSSFISLSLPLSLSLSLFFFTSPSLTSLILWFSRSSSSFPISLSLSLSLICSSTFLSLPFSLVLKRKKKGRKQEEEEAHSTALWAL